MDILSWNNMVALDVNQADKDYSLIVFATVISDLRWRQVEVGGTIGYVVLQRRRSQGKPGMADCFQRP